MKKFEFRGGPAYLGNRLAMQSDKKDKKKDIRFTIDKIMKEEMSESIDKSERYNKREKSKWIHDAIVILTKNPSYKGIILNAYWSKDREGGRKEVVVHDKVCWTFEQRCHFSDVRNSVVREYPDIRTPQTWIIRAAISYRLSRNY